MAPVHSITLTETPVYHARLLTEGLDHGPHGMLGDVLRPSGGKLEVVGSQRSVTGSDRGRSSLPRAKSNSPVAYQMAAEEPGVAIYEKTLPSAGTGRFSWLIIGP